MENYFNENNIDINQNEIGYNNKGIYQANINNPNELADVSFDSNTKEEIESKPDVNNLQSEDHQNNNESMNFQIDNTIPNVELNNKGNINYLDYFSKNKDK